MKNNQKKDQVRLSIDVPTDFYKVIKHHVIENDISIRKYILTLIKEDLLDELEDHMWGKIAVEAMKEGTIGFKESEKLLKEMANPPKKKKKTPTKKTTKNEKNKSMQKSQKVSK